MSEDPVEAALSAAIAEAILGVDTLWGGDVMIPSGVGRFIADSWFSDQPLPRAYTHYTAAAVRARRFASVEVSVTLSLCTSVHQT